MNRPEWLFKLKLYVKPDAVKSLNQLGNTVIPYLILMITLMVLAKHHVPYWFLLIFMPVTSCFMVRCFILMHDCSHKSFFRSEKVCAVIGHILGILTFTPFFDWRRAHLIHHVTVSNLDKRGTGDIWTLTLTEYLKSGILKRFLYQLYRNPFVILGFGPFFVFLISQRFPQKISKKKEIFSIIFTNIMLVLLVLTAHFTVGLVNYLIIQLPVFYLAGALGVWLFYVQHQFEDVYWEYEGKWSLYDAAMEGSSYYKLPRILQWFTGNIGFHNLHHLNPRIPNYNLMRCYRDMPEMRDTIIIKMVRGIKSIFLNVWDEKTRKLISFRAIKKHKPDLEQL